MLPLFIFEPRYRAMLEHALRMDRMFCVGFLSGDGDDESDEAIDPFSTAGLVRACIGHPDGTSHLVLQGVERIRIEGWEQREPFRIARVTPVETVLSDESAIVECSEALIGRAGEVLRRAGASELADRISRIENPEILADFVASNFLPDAQLRQPLLRMEALEDRLRYLLDCLPAEA